MPLLDQLRVVRDRLPVKRRQHQFTHAHVMLAIQQQDRRGSGDGLHYLPWLADVVLGWLPLEHLLDQRAIAVEQIFDVGMPDERSERTGHVAGLLPYGTPIFRPSPSW